VAKMVVSTDGILSLQAIPGGGSTTINNNANNRVITGSGTANTLEAESNLLYDAGSLTIQTANSGLIIQEYTGANTYYGFYANTLSGGPGSNNYTLLFKKDGTEGYLNAGTSTILAVAGTAELTATAGLVTVNDLKIGNSSTTGYVWTATDAVGNGSWQAAGSGSGDMILNATNTMGASGRITFPFLTTDSTLKVGEMEFQSSSAGFNLIAANLYHDGTNFKHRATGAVSLISMGGGTIQLYNATSQTAGTTATLSLSLAALATGAQIGIANGYLNFNTNSGSSGYGIRDNSGVMEAKNSGGAWSVISTGKSSAPTSAVAIANTETVVTSITVAANTLRAGSVIRVKGWCSQAGTNAATPTIRIRIGTTTLTGNIAATLTGAVGTSPVTSEFEGQVTIRSVGASGTAIGGLSQFKTGVAIASNTITSTVTVDTTVSNLLEFTFISGQAANTYTFQTAQIELIHPS
jgi:hypothetical protein